MHYPSHLANCSAQFIGVCSSVKTCDIGENLLSVSDPISGPQEMLIHAGILIPTPTLQRRHLPRLHPYAAVARALAPMSPVPEPRRWALGHVPLPARMQTLLVQRLSAHLQRSHPHAIGPEQTLAGVLDSRHLPVVSVVFVSSHRQRVGCPYPDQLSLVLVAAECRIVL